MYKVQVDSEGNILNQYRSPEVNPTHGTVDGTTTWLERGSFLEGKTSWWNGSDWVGRDAPPTKWHIWVSGAWIESADKRSVIQSNTMLQVRSMRNTLLGSCDWTQIPDAPLTDDKKSEWATYRQSLRDTPSTVVTDIADVSWPTVPS
tara:strand:- start:25 stop:465 length:441 start_codon:yes stop_codon:yes gene_type:complete